MGEGKDSSQGSHDTLWEEAVLVLTQWVQSWPGVQFPSDSGLQIYLFVELLTEEPCTSIGNSFNI